MMNETITEPARTLPVLGRWDVVVAGGGPAGCAAAASAAGNGAKTLLVEKDGYLGGATVSQTVAVVLSTNGVDFQGIWHEYARTLSAQGGLRLLGRVESQIRGSVDPELVKYAWDQILSAAGVDILHHVYGSCAVLEDGVARGLIAETRAGRRAILAKRIVDATGDGSVAAASGVPWDQGDGEHPYAMACTKVLRMGNVRWPEDWCTAEQYADMERRLDELIEAGEVDAPVVTTRQRLLNYLRGKAWQLPEHRKEVLSVISRVLEVDPMDPFDFTRAEREGREQARQAAEAMKAIVPGWDEAYLLDTNSQIGLRSSRRLRGMATVTDEDALRFRKYPDGVARSSWDIDVWPADSYTAPAVDRESDEWKRRKELMKRGEYFDIRYGCLVPQNMQNMLAAGRCISAEHKAESSLRIQQTCMATGEAAGTAAALSLNAGVTPANLDPAVLVARLEEMRSAQRPAWDFLKDIPVATRAREKV